MNTSLNKAIGMSGDLNVRLKLNRHRPRLDLSYRDLAFILHSQPSLPPYSDFPEDYSVEPNLFGAIGIDRNWGDWLTLGVITGLEKPATLTSPKGMGAATQGTNAPSGTTSTPSSRSRRTRRRSRSR